MCHEAAFKDWEKSKHAEQKIECFDCHQAHTQGVRTGSAETLCAACHSDEQTKLTHSVHGISGVDCGSCHMAKEMTDTATTGATVSASSHTFTVPADVCNRCHSDATHPAGNAQFEISQSSDATVADAGQAQLASKRVSELETELSDSAEAVGFVAQCLGDRLGFGPGRRRCLRPDLGCGRYVAVAIQSFPRGEVRYPMNHGEKLSRRDFLRLSAATVGAAVLASSLPNGAGASGGAGVAGRAAVPAMLIDLSRCVGCGNCQRSCVEANKLSPTTEQMQGIERTDLHVRGAARSGRGQDPLGEAPVHALRRCGLCVGVPSAGVVQDAGRSHRLPGGPLPGLPVLHGELPVRRAPLRVAEWAHAADSQVHVLL